MPNGDFISLTLSLSLVAGQRMMMVSCLRAHADFGWHRKPLTPSTLDATSLGSRIRSRVMTYRVRQRWCCR
uniref:Putative secreted protein n=1 Tax=Anopheles triannulatus TaxID=58253 RepID=A0A2M4B5U2_9DIPT